VGTKLFLPSHNTPGLEPDSEPATWEASNPTFSNRTSSTVEGTNREHGSSYLALIEYMGLLGILPFSTPVVSVDEVSGPGIHVDARTGSPYHYAIPFAMVTLAGLISRGF